MSINFTSSLVEAMDASYTEGTFVRTLGFFAPGDGGAAVYRVTGNVSEPIADKAIQYTDFTLYCSDGKFHLAPDANHPTRSVFQLIPRNNTVYAEQFGVMPGDELYSEHNQTMLGRAAMYTSSKGYILKFASKGTYYFAGGISLFDNTNIDGDGATLRFVGNSSGETFFHTPGTVENIHFSNISFIGRRTADNGYGDQFLYSRVENLVMKNVSLKNFAYGLRTYSIIIAEDYALPPILNKNWLIEDCSITDTVMGLQLSEIDGITIKDSTITSIYPKSFPVGTKGENDSYDGYDYPEAYIFDKLGGLHNIYMSANCLNVRLNNVMMGNVTGDAIHKAYAVNQEHANETYIRFDKSKNHFYTDISVHKCNAPVNMGFISENVMCDNVFGTNLRYLVHLSAASNCIVSNSSLTVDRLPFNRKGTMVNPNTGLYVHSACSCWFQNSYLSTNGNQRVGSHDTEDVYYRLMNIKFPENTLANVDDKKHRRIYIGSDFSIPNHWFKFTGCKMVSENVLKNYYFYEDINRVAHSDNAVPNTYQFGEYWDNCSLDTATSEDLFYMYCINDLPGGLTVRNSYINATKGTSKTPFRICCWDKNCADENNVCELNKYCLYAKYGKYFSWLHLENAVFKGFTNSYNRYGWDYVIAYGKSLSEINQAVKFSNTYGYKCYKLVGETYQPLTL
ncbi:MAG: hypothetical protein IJA87_04105 [Clostridia bacterium]|nr:hypothetical protein [Clostridia bacterium]